jgi:hypothetical protein
MPILESGTETLLPFRLLYWFCLREGKGKRTTKGDEATNATKDFTSCCRVFCMYFKLHGNFFSSNAPTK